MPRRKKQSSEAAVREMRRKTRRRFSAEEKIRIVLDGLRGEVSVAELCRRDVMIRSSDQAKAPTRETFRRSPGPKPTCIPHA